MTSANRKAWLGIASALVLLLGAASVVAFAKPPRVMRPLHAAAARWREMHTPGAGREQILQPEVQKIVTAMRTAGWQHYRFASRLENQVEISPFIVEASWPIVCRLSDDNVVGYVDELVGAGASCNVIDVIGELALGHCRP